MKSTDDQVLRVCSIAATVKITYDFFALRMAIMSQERKLVSSGTRKEVQCRLSTQE
jgi:hypothetical protein